MEDKSNPSTGLPEELEKMVKRAPVNRRIVMRDHTHEVLNWARKRICKWCADGSTPVWDERNKAVVHLSSYMRFDGNWWAVCAASVLREGLR